MLSHPGKLPSHCSNTRKCGCTLISLDCTHLAPAILPKLIQTTREGKWTGERCCPQHTPSQSIQPVQISILGQQLPSRSSTTNPTESPGLQHARQVCSLWEEAETLPAEENCSPKLRPQSAYCSFSKNFKHLKGKTFKGPWENWVLLNPLGSSKPTTSKYKIYMPRFSCLPWKIFKVGIFPLIYYSQAWCLIFSGHYER